MNNEQIKQVLESVKNNKLTDLFLHHKRWDALPLYLKIQLVESIRNLEKVNEFLASMNEEEFVKWLELN